MKEEIIRYIQENRVSTTEVADCMDKSGLLQYAYALNRGKFRVGAYMSRYTMLQREILS